MGYATKVQLIQRQASELDFCHFPGPVLEETVENWGF
jgi:hypothetical protein